MATNPPKPNGNRKIGNLRLVFQFAARYPGRIVCALIALALASATTVSIPMGFNVVIDEGFTKNGGDIGGGFRLLLGVVIVLGLATALRFYFVSWLGERVVADFRIAVQENLLRLSPSYFEENRPSEISSRLTADTSIIEQVVGTTVSVALRNIVMGIGGIGYLFAVAPRLTGDRKSVV